MKTLNIKTTVATTRTVAAKPSQFLESLKKNIDMLLPEQPIGCCPSCGVELRSDLSLYSYDEGTESRKLSAGLALLSERELTELSELLPDGKEYDQARGVIGHLIQLKQDVSAAASRRAS